MKANMGLADRIIRLVLAALAAILLINGIITGTWAIVIGILAGVFTLTAIIGFCPLYIPLGIKTLSKK